MCKHAYSGLYAYPQRSAPRRKHYAIAFQILKVVQRLQPATVQSRRQYALLYTLENNGMCCRWAAPAQEHDWVVRPTSRPAISDVKLNISYKGHAIKNGSELTPSQASDPPGVELG